MKAHYTVLGFYLFILYSFFIDFVVLFFIEEMYKCSLGNQITKEKSVTFIKRNKNYILNNAYKEHAFSLK
jgi:hypothetical protein